MQYNYNYNNQSVTAVFEAQEGRQASPRLSRDKCLKLQASRAGHSRERRNKNKGWPLFCYSPCITIAIILVLIV